MTRANSGWPARCAEAPGGVLKEAKLKLSTPGGLLGRRGHLGGLLGALGAILGASWAVLGRRKAKKKQMPKSFKHLRTDNR